MVTRTMVLVVHLLISVRMPKTTTRILKDIYCRTEKDSLCVELR